VPQPSSSFPAASRAPAKASTGLVIGVTVGALAVVTLLTVLLLR
jgi:hypothetical protein